MTSRPFATLATMLLAGMALADDDGTRLARGSDAISPFRQSLQAALQEGLARGPVEAINVCRLQAPDLALASSLAGIQVGRTSHRLRNPANAPTPWMGTVLEVYQSDPGQRRPLVVDLGGGRWGYAEPIVMQAPCLVCHGPAIAPDVKAKLDELYPGDQATGFAVGELRGLFWAEFDSAP